MSLLSALQEKAATHAVQRTHNEGSSDLLGGVEKVIADAAPLVAVSSVALGVLTGAPVHILAWRGVLCGASALGQRWHSEAQNARTLDKFSKEARQQIENLTDLQSQLTEQIAILSSSRERSEEENERLHKLVSRQELLSTALNTKLVALSKTEAELSETSSELAKVKDEVKELTSVRDELKEEVRTLRVEVGALREVRDELRSVSKDLATHVKELKMKN